MATDWRQALLNSLGAPASPANLQFLDAWQRQEGGVTHNDASYNWLNTTRGSQFPAINSVGVRAYPNFQTGINHLRDTILNGRYPNLVSGLRSGTPVSDAVVADLSTWVSGSPTSAHGQRYAAKVMGTQPRTPTPAQPAPSAVAQQAAVPKPPKQGIAPREALVQQAEEQVLTQNPRQQAYDFLGMALNYATEGAVSSNVFANMAGAVAPKGTVEPPVVKDKKTGQPKIPTPPKKANVTPKGGEINKMLAAAHTQVGKPYVFGSGPSTDSFDCSDLVQWAYKQIGVDIPRVTWDQIKVGRPVKWGEFQPGDLIFSNKGGHVTMYVGNGKVIAAPYTGTVVQYQPVSRFKKSFVTAKRII